MAQTPIHPGRDRLVELHHELRGALATMDPETQDWALQTLEELFTDLDTHALLAQVWPEIPGPDPATWQPSTPPPGWGRAEYGAFRAGFVAGWQSVTQTKGRGQ